MKNMKGRDYLKDLGLDGRIIIDLKEVRLEGVDLNLSPDRDHWWALINMIMNLEVSF
jgi:hypothetical protein